MFSHQFVINAYLAGTFIALGCGLIGWFALLRVQLFAGDALTHAAFVGAIAAATLGVDERIGLFALTLVAAALMTSFAGRGTGEDPAIGMVFAWILGIGILLITVLSMSSRGANGVTAAGALFGSIYSLSSSAAIVAAAVAVGSAGTVMVLARPLLLSSLDPEQAQARGIPVRALGVLFLALLAIITAEATQAVGALLVLGLLAAPAGAAHRMTSRPYAGLALSGGLAVSATWSGLALSYAISSLPPSSAIIGVTVCTYALTGIAAGLRSRTGARPKSAL